MKTLILILLTTPALAGPIRTSNCDPGWVPICEPCGECNQLYEDEGDASGIVSGSARSVPGFGSILSLSGMVSSVAIAGRPRTLPPIPPWVGTMPRLPEPDTVLPTYPIPPLTPEEIDELKTQVPESRLYWLLLILPFFTRRLC